MSSSAVMGPRTSAGSPGSESELISSIVPGPRSARISAAGTGELRKHRRVVMRDDLHRASSQGATTGWTARAPDDVADSALIIHSEETEAGVGVTARQCTVGGEVGQGRAGSCGSVRILWRTLCVLEEGKAVTSGVD